MLRQGPAFWFVLVLGLLMAGLIIGGGFYLAVNLGTVELGGPPDMAATMTTSSNQVAAGGEVTYTIAYENKGENPAGSVSMTISLPAGSTIGEIVPSAACTPSGTTVTCRLGTQNPQRSGAVTVTATIDSSAAKGTELQAQATIETATTRDEKKSETVEDNNTATAVVTVQ